MTTSGNYSFDLYRNQILELAFHAVGASSPGNPLTNEQIELGSMLLNAMVQNWRADNVYLWEEEWLVKQFIPSSIVLATDGFEYTCILNNLSTSATEPGVGTEWIPYWSQLNTSSGAPAWAIGNNYTFVGNFDLDPTVVAIRSARIFQAPTSFEQFILPMTEEMYFTLGDISIVGKPTQYFFRRLPTPQIFLYPAPDIASNYAIQFAVYRYTQTLDNASDTSTFLNEWMRPLWLGLAVELASGGEGVATDRFGMLKTQFKDAYDIAKQLDHEKGPINFMPQLRR